MVRCRIRLYDVDTDRFFFLKNFVNYFRFVVVLVMSLFRIFVALLGLFVEATFLVIYIMSRLRCIQSLQHNLVAFENCC